VESDVPDFEITAWVRPHRPGGLAIHFDSSTPEFSNEIWVQEPALGPRLEGFDFDQPFRRVPVTVEWIWSVVSSLDNARFSLRADANPGYFGGSFFGLHVRRGFREFAIIWHGEFGAQDPEVCSLWNLLYSSAEGAPYGES